MAGALKMEKVEEKVETKVVEKPVAEKVPDDGMMGFYPIKDLPSKYKLYPEGTLIYGRPLRVLEVRQLSQMGEDNSANVINNVLRSATKGLKVENMFLADKIYIIFWLRANTYKDPGYRVDFKCMKCEQPSNYSFGLEALKVTYIKDTYVDGTPFELPVSKDKVILGYQTVANVIEMENLKSKSIGNPLVSYDDDVLSTASCIVSVNEKIMSLKQKYDYLIDLDSGDYARIATEQLDNEMGISTIIDVKCNKCGETSPAGLSFRPDFFIPKYKT
jgi:hypothetical protein